MSQEDKPVSQFGWLAEELASHFRQALEAMTGVEVRVSAGPSDGGPPGGPGWLIFRQVVEGADDAWLAVAGAEAVCMEIGSRVLSAAGLEDQAPEDLRGTFLEVVRQGLSSAVRALAAKSGRRLECGAGESPSQSPEAALWFRLTVEWDEGSPAPLFAGISAGLKEALVEKPEAAAGEATPASPEHPREAFRRTEIAQSSETIDLLLEVELPVSVSFGRAQLPLKDVIKLSTGSIVELNRTVNDPVEVIVNNCVVARGEVVVVDGNYGVRIRQIVTPEERLRSLY